MKTEFLNDGESVDDRYLVMEDSDPEQDGRGDMPYITVGFTTDKNGNDPFKKWAFRPTERVGINMIEKIPGEMNVTPFVKKDR